MTGGESPGDRKRRQEARAWACARALTPQSRRVTHGLYLAMLRLVESDERPREEVSPGPAGGARAVLAAGRSGGRRVAGAADQGVLW